MNQCNTSPVRLHNVCKSYNFNNKVAEVLHQVSLEVNQGELLLLLGPSGSGKTTLLTIIAGLIAPSEGEVYLFNKKNNLYSKSEFQSLLAHKIGFVFQAFNLIDSLTAIENIAISAQFAGWHKAEALSKAKDILISLEIEHLSNKKPQTLSQGEKQRVAVGRALINKPELILADEPTASLEGSQGLAIIKLLRKYANENKSSIIVVSHDQRICGYADRILIVRDGYLTENNH